MKLFLLHFFKKTQFIWLYSFLTFVNFSCQEIERKSNLSPSDYSYFSAITTDVKPISKFNQNKYYQLFYDTKCEIGLSLDNMKYRSKDFLTFAALFHSENEDNLIERVYYYDDDSKSDSYKLEYNSGKLIRVYNTNTNHLEITFKYDNSDNLIEVVESHKYPDLIETNQNRVRHLKGKESIIRTTNMFKGDILLATIYDENIIKETGGFLSGGEDIDSFFYFVNKSDPTIKIVKELNINKLDSWSGKPSNFKHYVLKDNKLAECIEYNADSTVYSVYEFSYLSEKEIRMDYYKNNGSNSLEHRLYCIIEIDSEFRIQNISLHRRVQDEIEIFEKQFVYVFNENDLVNIQISKREYIQIHNDKSNISNFKKEQEFLKLN